MVERLETVQDVEKAFGLPPRPAEKTVDAVSARPAEKALSDQAFSLSRSYEVRGVMFAEIALRPPRGHEFWEIGDIVEWQLAGTSQPIRIENLSAIRAYAERCASVPGEPSITGSAIVEALDMRDTLAIRKAVSGFFAERPAKDSG